ncbi:DUF732 domain-containing protein [Mycobacterium sp. ITM-2016-00318]|uniref:DUF732 domain-containing protein n=1 Tax=Mycobacterium sp. ITM-2016-00318 TaxID=2099693 RepID=UPI001E47F7BD|nr:DUF732 domain-containing protein [Mycobacterium sp. ITM-2016-00318]WNG90683.1 DUF732 domain-containing protein [Mycobacterium sp. ITM-2016-00318]
MRRLSRPVRLITVFAGVTATASLLASPAQADPGTDAFLDAVTGAGLGGTTDPSNLVAVGQSVCPMLSEPGQTAADAAAEVADATGMSLGGANMFTSLAISFLCPRVLESIGAGQSPIPLGLLGI